MGDTGDASSGFGGTGDLLGDLEANPLADDLRDPSKRGFSSMKTVGPRGPGQIRPKRSHWEQVGCFSSDPKSVSISRIFLNVFQSYRTLLFGYC